MFTFRAMYSSKANQTEENNDDERKGEPKQRNAKETSWTRDVHTAPKR